MLTKNNAVRCDRCGKLSRNPLGEYTKSDGISAGYILADVFYELEDTGRDYCEECGKTVLEEADHHHEL